MPSFRFGTVCIGAVLCALFALVIPARAGGDCPGMSDYTYQAGACSDNTGDFSSALEKSYDRDYELGISRNRRMESGSSTRSSSTGGGNTAAFNAQAAQRMFFTRQANTLYPAWFARNLYPNDARSRASVAQVLAALTNSYYQHGLASGFTPNSIPDAEEFFIMSTYRVFNGDHYSNMIRTRLGYQVIVEALTHNPKVLALNNTGRQFLAESYIVRGFFFASLYADAQKRHDTGEIAMVRTAAREGLRNELGVDPASVRLDQLACLRPHPFSCEEYIKLRQASVGGPAPTVRDFSRMISPFGAR